MPGLLSFPFPPSRPAFPALCVAGRPVRLSLTLACLYAIPCGLCVPGAWFGCPSGIPRVPFACVCARALAVSASFLPPRVGVARAACRVLVQGAGRALPRGPCPSAFPASVPCALWLACGRGRPGPVPPVPCFRSCAPLRAGLCNLGGLAPGGAGGSSLCRLPRGRGPGALRGRGVALPRSVTLPSLCGHQSGCHRRRSVHGGRGRHFALVRVRVPTPAVVCGAHL